MRDIDSWIVSAAKAAFRGKHQDRRRSYRGCFFGSDGAPSGDGTIVLADLRRFCKATDTSFVPGDPHATSLNEGRREVWIRIQHYLELDDATVALMVEHEFTHSDLGADDDG